MMRRTTLADRQAIVALKRAGQSHAEVAAHTAWDVELVRKVWRAYRRHGADGLNAARLGRPAQGPLSTFPWLVRLAALRVKCQRPHAGPDVVLAEMAVRPSLAGLVLPSAASLSAYFGTFGERLLTPRVGIGNCRATRLSWHRSTRCMSAGCWTLTRPSTGPAWAGLTS